MRAALWLARDVPSPQPLRKPTDGGPGASYFLIAKEEKRRCSVGNHTLALHAPAWNHSHVTREGRWHGHPESKRVEKCILIV